MGKLIGVKKGVNEFMAYLQLADLLKLGMKAMIVGSLVTFMTANVAGMLID